MIIEEKIQKMSHTSTNYWIFEIKKAGNTLPATLVIFFFFQKVAKKKKTRQIGVAYFFNKLVFISRIPA